MFTAEYFLDMHFKDGKFVDIFKKETAINYTKGLNRENKLILYYLYKYGEVTMGEITNTFFLPHSTTNFTINKLQKKGFVDIKVDTNDNRVRKVFLTDKGSSEIQEMLKALDCNLHNLFKTLYNIISTKYSDDFSEEEIKAIDKFMNIIF